MKTKLEEVVDRMIDAFAVEREAAIHLTVARDEMSRRQKAYDIAHEIRLGTQGSATAEIQRVAKYIPREDK